MDCLIQSRYLKGFILFLMFISGISLTQAQSTDQDTTKTDTTSSTQEKMQVVPQPRNDQINIYLPPGLQKDEYQFQVVDNIEQVKVRKFIHKNQRDYQISVAHLTPGYYEIQIVEEDSVIRSHRFRISN